MLAYLIDPALRRVTDIELPNDVRGSLDEMRRLIGCQYLEHWRLSDVGDELWHDELAIERCMPVFAFQFRNKRGNSGPFGGKSIVTGADDVGDNAPPKIPRAWIENDIDWLDEIVPDIHWITETADLVHGQKMSRMRRIVTWSRAK